MRLNGKPKQITSANLPLPRKTHSPPHRVVTFTLRRLVHGHGLKQGSSQTSAFLAFGHPCLVALEVATEEIWLLGRWKSVGSGGSIPNRKKTSPGPASDWYPKWRLIVDFGGIHLEKKHHVKGIYVLNFGGGGTRIFSERKADNISDNCRRLAFQLQWHKMN